MDTRKNQFCSQFTGHTPLKHKPVLGLRHFWGVNSLFTPPPSCALPLISTRNTGKVYAYIGNNKYYNLASGISGEVDTYVIKNLCVIPVRLNDFNRRSGGCVARLIEILKLEYDGATP